MSTTDTPAHCRHDISDRAWETIAPHPSGGPGKVGRPAEDNRRFINAVFRSPPHRRTLARPTPGLRTPDITAHRFGRWQKSGKWAKLLAEVSDARDFEWLMIDASHVKVHQHGTGAVDGNQAVGRTKGG